MDDDGVAPVAAVSRCMGHPDGPFLGREALAVGLLTERALRREYRLIYPGVYVPRDTQISARDRAVAAWLWSRRRGVPVGYSAAALLGVKWLSPALPAQVVHANHSAPPLLQVRRDTLTPGETVAVGDVMLTSPARTAFDLGRRIPSRLHALQRLDALVNATGVTIEEIKDVITAHKGARGLNRLRRILALVDGGAESPQETHTRLVLIDGGLPRPETQINVHDDYGDFIGRIDMGYRDLKVGVEYDGVQHWLDPHQRTRDIDRAARLEEQNWRIIRVGAELLRNRRPVIVARTEAAMRAAGW